MKIGGRGQVTIPKEIREQFGLTPETEVEFRVAGGSIILKKAPKKLNLAKWKGRCAGAFTKLGYSSVDKFRSPALRQEAGQCRDGGQQNTRGRQRDRIIWLQTK